MNIGPVPIGHGHPCQIGAEVSNAHNGDRLQAHRLIDAIAGTGVKLIKFQAYTPDELVTLRGDGPAPEPWGSQGWTMRDLYTKAQTPLDWLPELFTHARDVGLTPFASVFGPESFAALEAVGCPAYKVARLDNGQASLVTLLQHSGRPVVVSGTSIGDLISDWSNGSDFFLYCPPGYPPTRGAVQLPMFGGWPSWDGVSLHTLDPDIPLLAVARGATLIEMHVQLDDAPSALERDVSLTITQLANLVDDVRGVEAVLA